MMFARSIELWTRVLARIVSFRNALNSTVALKKVQRMPSDVLKALKIQTSTCSKQTSRDHKTKR